MRLAISGYKRSGKDTVANMISDKSKKPVYIFPIGDLIKNVYEVLFNGNPYSAELEDIDRKKLIRLHNCINNEFENVFINKVIDEMENYSITEPVDHHFIVPDVRRISEANILKREGFKFLRIESSLEETGYDKELEKELDNYSFDYKINNYKEDHSLDDLSRKVDNCVHFFKL